MYPKPPSEKSLDVPSFALERVARLNEVLEEENILRSDETNPSVFSFTNTIGAVYKWLYSHFKEVGESGKSEAGQEDHNVWS